MRMRAFTNRAARTSALVGAVAAAGLLLTACGGDGAAPSASATASPSATAAAPGSAASPAPAPGPFNDADVLFAQMMIPHHEQALEMARLADGRAEDADVKKLVAAIERAQDPEIRTMRAWLKGWDRPESADNGSDHGGGHGSGHGSGSGMAGMMSEQDMKRLAAAEGKEFDRAFAELMIAHHEGAVAMAEDERKDGLNATAKKLADDVVRTQSAEVAELRKVLDRL